MQQIDLFDYAKKHGYIHGINRFVKEIDEVGFKYSIILDLCGYRFMIRICLNSPLGNFSSEVRTNGLDLNAQQIEMYIKRLTKAIFDKMYDNFSDIHLKDI